MNAMLYVCVFFHPSLFLSSPPSLYICGFTKTDNCGMRKWKTLSISIVLLLLSERRRMANVPRNLKTNFRINNWWSLKMWEAFNLAFLLATRSRFLCHDWNLNEIFACSRNKFCRLRIYYCWKIFNLHLLGLFLEVRRISSLLSFFIAHVKFLSNINLVCRFNQELSHPSRCLLFACPNKKIKQTKPKAFCGLFKAQHVSNN